MKKYLILFLMLVIPTLSYSKVSLGWSFTEKDARIKAENYMKGNKPDLKDYELTKMECIDCGDIYSEYKKPRWFITYKKPHIGTGPITAGGEIFLTIDRSGKISVTYGE